MKTAWNNEFMALALEHAKRAKQAGEVPVGAVIARNGEVIATAHNETISRYNPTAHAEMLVIQAACNKLQTNYLTDCDLYVTLEPCTMCTQAIAFSRVKRLIYGASDPKGGGVEHGARVFNQPTCHHKPEEILSGIEAEAAGILLKDFFAAKR